MLQRNSKNPKTADVRYLQTRLSEKSWQDWKVLSAQINLPMQGMTLEAMNDFMRKHGKRPRITGPDVE